MARKVNTRFVITLGTALGVVGIGGGAYMGWTLLRNRNPAYLKAQGDALEKQGDLNKAYTMYHRAVIRAAGVHMAGGEELCMKTAEMALKLSEQQTDRDAAQQFWREARGIWQEALIINPRYLPARERILEEDFNLVSAIPSAQNWTMLQESSDKLIEMAPNYANAYYYRANARFELLRFGAGGNADPNDTLLKIQKDLQDGQKLAPNDGRIVALMAVTNSRRAEEMTARSLIKEGDKLREDGTAMLQKFLAKNPNDPDASIALWQVLSPKKPDDARQVLEKALAANPNNEELVGTLASVYVQNQFEKSEKVLKDYLAAHPNATEQYWVLARLYESKGKLPEAIAAYKEVLNHPMIGGGVAAFKNSEYELQAWYSLGNLYLSVAEREGVSSAAGKDALAQATSYADKFRAGGAAPGPLALLDARMQLLRANVDQALASLKRADANLGGTNPLPGNTEYWFTTKMLMAQVYMMKGEWGLALEQLDLVHNQPQLRPLVELQRAQMLNQVGRYMDAYKVATQLADLPDLPANMKDGVLRAKATALYQLGNRADAEKVMASIDSVSASLALAGGQIAKGQYEDALDALNRVLEKEPDNRRALFLAIAVQIHLERKAEAAKLIDRALVKYPNDPQLQVAKASLAQKDNNTEEAQAELIKSITDDYTRWMFYAQLYQKYGHADKELEALQNAEKSLGDVSNDAMADVVQRIFGTALLQAESAKNPATKTQMIKLAQSYADKAQRQNLDGVNGALFLSELQYKQGQKKEAIATLEQTLADHPDFSRAHALLGVMYGDVGRIDSALEQLRMAIKEKPDDILALKNAIRLLNQRGDSGSLEEAKNDLKQAMLFAPRDPEIMAFADVKELNDPASAIDTREQIYRKDPSNLDNLERLAGLYVQTKQANKAIELLRPVYDKNPDDIRVADSLARLYRETQQTNEAQTIYERFIGSDDPQKRFEGTLLLGGLFNSLGQNEQAAATYKAAIQLAPTGDDRGERRLADLYFDMEQMADAEALYQKIYDQGPANAKDMGVLRRIVETQIRQHKYADADQLLKNIIFKHDPNDPEGLVLQGYSNLSQGDSKSALASFNVVLAKDPTNPDALHYRALAQYTMQGDLEQAAKDLMTVQDRNQNAINSRLLLARIYRVSHRLSEATSEYRDVVALRPDLIPARVEYAQYLMELSRVQQRLLPDNTDDVAYMIRSINPIQTLQSLLVDSADHFPKDSQWQVMAGDLLTLVGRQADAQKLYEQAFNASNEQAFNAANEQALNVAIGRARAAASAYLDSLLRLHNYEEAIALVNKIGAVRANNIDDYVKRGTAYAAINKAEEAIADFGRALDLGEKDLNLVTVITHQMVAVLPTDKVISMMQARLAANPGSTAARLALGQSLLAGGRASEAAHVLLPLKATTDPQQKAIALRNLALAEYEAKDFDSANTDYQELLKIVPDDIESLNNLSFMLADDMKRPADGLVFAQRAAKILRGGAASVAFVNNGNVYDTLGWVECLNGDYDNGIHDLHRAIQSEPSPIAYYHLGRAYQKSGQKDDAGKAVQEGLKLASGLGDPAEAQLLALKAELGK